MCSGLHGVVLVASSVVLGMHCIVAAVWVFVPLGLCGVLYPHSRCIKGSGVVVWCGTVGPQMHGAGSSAWRPMALFTVAEAGVEG